MVEGFVEYRHPVQGWTMSLPVEDAENPPEVFYVRGARLERADLAPSPRPEALALVVGRALHAHHEPVVWEGMTDDAQAPWLERGGVAVRALVDAGAMTL